MKFEKSKELINKFLDSNTHIRWAILGLSTILFVIILYPSLVITQHPYSLGDVVERDIKAPKDFFVEDQAATEKNRQQAVAAVLTVYDYDVNMADDLKRKVEQAFGDLRTLIESKRKMEQQEMQYQAPPADTRPAEQNPSLQTLIWEKQKQFEETIGISISKGAYRALAREDFSKNLSHCAQCNFSINARCII